MSGVDVTTAGGVLTARLVGPSIEERQATEILDSARSAIAEAGDAIRHVVLDFEDVSFINSSGLAACIEVRNAANAQGATTIIYRPSETVIQLFRMVKVDRLYTFAHNADELKACVSQPNA